jgi:hypothetical protein
LIADELDLEGAHATDSQFFLPIGRHHSVRYFPVDVDQCARSDFPVEVGKRWRRRDCED